MLCLWFSQESNENVSVSISDLEPDPPDVDEPCKLLVEGETDKLARMKEYIQGNDENVLVQVRRSSSEFPNHLYPVKAGFFKTFSKKTSSPKKFNSPKTQGFFKPVIVVVTLISKQTLSSTFLQQMRTNCVLEGHI